MKTVELFDIVEISKKEGNATYRIGLNQQNEGLLGYRVAGTTFGGHWHEGKSLSKNPETLYLLEGIIELSTKHTSQNDVTTIKVKAPKGIKLHVNTWHKLYAVTNVCFVELNSLQEHVEDTKYPKS